MATAKRSRARPRDPNEIQTRLAEAALSLAAVQGWRDTTLADIATEAGVPLSQARRHAPSKFAVLAAYTRRIDEIVLDGTDKAIADEPARDRLFDVMMRRFDAMAAQKKGIAAVVAEMRRDPAFATCFARGPRRRSLVWMLEAARLPSWGPLRAIQVEGLGLVYMGALRAWLDDDSEDQGKTMSALDKGLGRADAIARWLTGGRRRGTAEPPPEPPPGGTE